MSDDFLKCLMICSILYDQKNLFVTNDPGVGMGGGCDTRITEQHNIQVIIYLQPILTHSASLAAKQDDQLNTK